MCDISADYSKIFNSYVESCREEKSLQIMDITFFVIIIISSQWTNI